MTAPAQFSPLSAAYPEAEYWEESNVPYVFFPALKFESGGKLKVMQALLCPAKRDGYATRLFLQEQIPDGKRKWQAHTIRGRAWWTFSWKDVPASLPWLEILANHLRPLQ